ncbi:hypothetical protein CesoFtcFv8_021754 [Champsocephalus esox]|uniref:Argonaute hook domain-containing protein n=1 Tax=Champsocephalus esox TaxID=159716 RepID=A0AAN8B9W5_9TELE|nr:hypothetical protein CesoFtcFv8_021754 [Champsocephalus esox]
MGSRLKAGGVRSGGMAVEEELEEELEDGGILGNRVTLRVEAGEETTTTTRRKKHQAGGKKWEGMEEGMEEGVEEGVEEGMEEGVGGDQDRRGGRVGTGESNSPNQVAEEGDGRTRKRAEEETQVGTRVGGAGMKGLLGEPGEPGAQGEETEEGWESAAVEWGGPNPIKVGVEETKCTRCQTASRAPSRRHNCSSNNHNNHNNHSPAISIRRERWTKGPCKGAGAGKNPSPKPRIRTKAQAGPRGQSLAAPEEEEEVNLSPAAGKSPIGPSGWGGNSPASPTVDNGTIAWGKTNEAPSGWGEPEDAGGKPSGWGNPSPNPIKSGSKSMQDGWGDKEVSVAATRHSSWEDEEEGGGGGGGGMWNSAGSQGSGSSWGQGSNGGWGQSHQGKKPSSKGPMKPGGGDSWMSPINRQFSNMGLLNDDPSGQNNMDLAPGSLQEKKMEAEKRAMGMNMNDYNGDMRKVGRGGGGGGGGGLSSTWIQRGSPWRFWIVL